MAGNQISVFTIQILVIISETNGWMQPDYPLRIFNTETVILSLGDPDDAKNNDLEIIKASPGKLAVERKLSKFHKYVNLIEMTESPEDRYFSKSYNKFKNSPPVVSMSSLPQSGDGDEKHFKTLARRKKKRKEKRLRSLNMPRFKKNSRIRKRQAYPDEMPDGGPEDKTDDYLLEKEYMDFVSESFRTNTAFKYSDEGKPEENFKEIMYKIIDIKPPHNCTQFTGIGLQAIQCTVQDYKHGRLDQLHMIYFIFKIVLIWFAIYLAVALPLWCVKGWCCCCLPCEFCQPNRTVKDIQKYVCQNPPGIFINSEGEEERYHPTQNEIELYERLKRSINEF